MIKTLCNFEALFSHPERTCIMLTTMKPHFLSLIRCLDHDRYSLSALIAIVMKACFDIFLLFRCRHLFVGDESNLKMAFFVET